MKKYIYIILGALLVFFSACEDLDVENNNNPDQERVLSSARDFKLYAQNIYFTYWITLKGSQSTNIQIASLTAADQFTASWYNFGCYDMSIEPRIQWNNSANYEYITTTYNFYTSMYTVLLMSNNIINKVNGGFKISSDSATNMGYVALAYFMQGLALGQLGITFDKAQIVLENYMTPKPVPYDSVINAAITSLDKAAEIAHKYKFDLGTSIINGKSLTSDLIFRASHSFAARFLILKARTKTENTQADWLKVLSYTTPDKSINADFGPMGDGGTNWMDEIMSSLTNVDNTDYFYAKVDCRLIHLMDPAYPAVYPANGRAPRVHSDKHAGEASSADKRLNAYFEFSELNRFYADRGVYHYSHYRYKRYDNIRLSQTGQFIDMSYYENVLMRIEALTMTKAYNVAALMLNNEDLPRKKAGGLPNVPLNADSKTILNAIFYEREIELLGQSYLIGFSDMRRRDMLQKGTPLHFPVPAVELQTLGMDWYTFGGEAYADGTNTSNTGWK